MGEVMKNSGETRGMPTVQSAEEDQRSAVLDPAAERRRGERLATSYSGAFQLGAVSYNVEIVDMSESGARVRVRRGIVPRVDQIVSLRFLDGRTAEAVVVRSHGIEIGVRFKEPIEDWKDVIHFDEMGADFYKCILRFQVARDR